jgi:phage-related protein (TIGR01555 family)
MVQIVKVDNLDSAILNRQTGLGMSGYDSSMGNRFNQLMSFGSENYVFLSRLYRQSWHIRKVCKYFPSEMTKCWGRLIIEKNLELQKNANAYLDGLRKYYRQGQTFANLYGGAGYVRFIEDGRELEEPVDWKNIKSVAHSRLYDRWELNINYDSSAIAVDPYNPDFYYFFSYSPSNAESKLRTGQRIHKDRILRFRGNELPPFEQINNNGWEDSVLQVFLQPLKTYLAGLGYVTESLRNFEVIVLKTLDLHDAITSGNETLIKERGQMISNELSAMRPIMMDKNNEDMQIIGRNFNNVVEIVQLALREMIASSEIDPGEFYKEKDQIKANSKEERLATAGRIRSLQEEKWHDLICDDIRLFLAPFGIKEDDWLWEWESTYSETEDDKVAREFTLAQTMEKYINLGVLSPQEVRKSLFDNPDSTIMLMSEELPVNPQDTPQVNESVKEEVKQLDGLKPRFIPNGEVLPDSFYEAPSLEELMAVEDD